MPLKTCGAFALGIGAAAVCMLIASGLLSDVLAQTGPLGIPRPSTPAAPPPDGFTGWLLAKQAEYYRAMSGAIRGAKSDNTALLALFGDRAVVVDAVEAHLQVRAALRTGLKASGTARQFVFTSAVMAMARHPLKIK